MSSDPDDVISPDFPDVSGMSLAQLFELRDDPQIRAAIERLVASRRDDEVEVTYWPPLPGDPETETEADK